MLTTSEAAEVLGVTPRRVVALVESGALVAERFGRQWMVDERSVRDRASAPKLSGRPKLGQKDLLALSAHTLMNRDHPVLDFTYDRKQKRARIERVHDEALWGPLGMGRRARKPRGLAPSGSQRGGPRPLARTPTCRMRPFPAWPITSSATSTPSTTFTRNVQGSYLLFQRASLHASQIAILGLGSFFV